jgi:hypothetical protein
MTLAPALDRFDERRAAGTAGQHSGNKNARTHEEGETG